MARARLQGELTGCQAEHALQFHAIRIEAEAHLRSFEIEVERRHEEALGKRLKKAEAIHTHRSSTPSTTQHHC